MRPLLLLLLMLAGPLAEAWAQGHYAYPLNSANYLDFEGMLHVPGQQVHTSVRPFRESELNAHMPFDSLRQVRYHKGKFSRTWTGRKIMMESLFKVDSSQRFQVYFDPILHLDIGMDLAAKENNVVNTRGFVCKGSIGKHVSFFTAFWENQATFMPYMTDWIEHNRVIPGQGWLKPFEFNNGMYTAMGVKANGYDYLSASGSVTYAPTANFNVQLGHDKHFIGEGYRSLLLSDAPFNYPFLKLTSKYRRWQYVHLLTQLQDVRHPTIYETGYKKKYGTFHYLSVAIGNRVQLGLFEGIILTTGDTMGNGGFDWNFLQPLMMVRPVQFQFYDSRNNAVVGLNLKTVLWKGGVFYGQLAVDDIDFTRLGRAGYIGQKLGWQAGIKSYGIWGPHRLFGQVEYNAVRPYTFASTEVIQNYMHYSQPLGHPLGANFHELTGAIAYSWKDLRFEFRTTYAIVGRDSVGISFGNDIYRSDSEAARGASSSGNHIGQGLRTGILYQNAELAYVINRATNFCVRIGVTHRHATNAQASERNLMPYFGFRTDIRNLYYDF